MMRRNFVLRSMKTAAICALVALARCDDEPELPKEEKKPAVRTVEVDVQHSAHIRADRAFTIGNIVLVLQADPSHAMTGVTLSSSRAAVDGSRLIFGSYEKIAAVDDWPESGVDLVGSSFYDARGNGIFTPLGAYQPKSAVLRVTSHTKDEARGTIRGEFYQFKPGAPTLHPHITNVEATFSAKLIQR